jgi:hypothetical protein
MYLSKLYDPAARAYRIRYAIISILRDRVVNGGAFACCFEMENEDEVVLAILRRGLKNPRLLAALENSHIIDLNRWLVRHPEFAEPYHARRTTSWERL